MTRFFLVWHGETLWNDAARYQGQEDVPLSPRGRVEAKRLAERFVGESIAAIYASDLARPRDGAGRRGSIGDTCDVGSTTARGEPG